MNTTKELDWKKPLKTVYGEPARLVCSDFKSYTEHSFLVLVLGSDQKEYIVSYRKDGSSNNGSTLMNCPEERWVILYRRDNVSNWSSRVTTYKSRDEAEQWKNRTHIKEDKYQIALIKVQIE